MLGTDAKQIFSELCDTQSISMRAKWTEALKRVSILLKIRLGMPKCTKTNITAVKAVVEQDV